MGVLSTSLGSVSMESVESLEANDEKLSREGVVTEETTDGDGEGSFGVLRVNPEEKDGAADGSRSWVPVQSKQLAARNWSVVEKRHTCFTSHGANASASRSCARDTRNA